jgi:seryl-tRNA synthetase
LLVRFQRSAASAHIPSVFSVSIPCFQASELADQLAAAEIERVELQAQIAELERQLAAAQQATSEAGQAGSKAQASAAALSKNAVATSKQLQEAAQDRKQLEEKLAAANAALEEQKQLLTSLGSELQASRAAAARVSRRHQLHLRPACGSLAHLPIELLVTRHRCAIHLVLPACSMPSCLCISASLPKRRGVMGA